MGTIGYGYGSEWHFLRYLGYHRHSLNKAIEDTISNDTGRNDVKVADWIDFDFQNQPEDGLHRDKEWVGLSFLPSNLPIHKEWANFWPPKKNHRNQQNWDAVGYVQVDSQNEILLVEAKAHVEELKSPCKAESQGGLPMITNALNDVKRYYGVKDSIDWLKPYYQYANRLAVLYFLNTHNIPARLIFIYFMGDDYPSKICPKNNDEWRKYLNDMYNTLGLGDKLPLQRVHNIFPPVLI